MNSTNKTKTSHSDLKKTDKANKDTKIIGRKFTKIHLARELAVQFLYALDMRPEQDFNEAFDSFFSPSTEDMFDEAKNTPEIKSLCKKLIQNIHENSDEIDQILLHVLTGWRPERIFSVDRAVLRIMILEACIKKTLPLKVSMAEAASLANDFGSKDSARFVSGVLSKIFKTLEQNTEA